MSDERKQPRRRAKVRERPAVIGDTLHVAVRVTKGQEDRVHVDGILRPLQPSDDQGEQA